MRNNAISATWYRQTNLVHYTPSSWWCLVVGLSGQNKLGTWRANRGGLCHRMNMNKNVDKESESEKKVRVERKC